MKTTIVKLLVLLAVPVLYYVVVTGWSVSKTEPVAESTNVSLVTPPPAGKNFENIIWNWNVRDMTNQGVWIQNQIDRYGQGDLNFTGVHLYDYVLGQLDDGSDWYGRFNQNLSGTQVAHIEELRDSVSSHNLNLYFERCKISKLCYAQRLVYEVSNGGSTTVNEGFCYQNTGGEYTTDQGRTVLHATDPAQQFPTGYWLAKNIYENFQHGNYQDFGTQMTDTGKWYMKPVMRIDSNIVDNYPEKPVVRIVVTSYHGDTVKNVVIKARNFAHFIGGYYLYDGRYIDVFDFTQDPGANLEVTGGDGKSIHNPPQLNDGQRMEQEPHYWMHWLANCHADFKVYWCGEVEVWFDRMVVDDEYANKMFNPDPQQNYDPVIEDELSHTSQHDFTYFADEVTFSHVPCIKYVKNKIHEYNPDIRLNVAVCNYNRSVGNIPEAFTK